MRVHVLHGVNLDTLGRRDPAHYGVITLPELEGKIREWAEELGLEAFCRQTNFEGQYVEWLHEALDDADAVIVNPGAWTHYSWAIHDALELLEVPIAEVHLSNIEAREEWRRSSVVRDVAAITVMGKGPDGYREALEFLAR
ncbi:MAG: type II 3-dehydroquinate dehydratase [Gaiellaceae bacterium]|jgi:3-dehydroquinate dehydratase-2